MANPHRGEVALAAGDRTLTLVYSFDAICRLEERLDMSIAAIGALLEDPAKLRFSRLRPIIWAGLVDRQPEITENDIGEIVDAAGLTAVLAAMGQAFQLAFPQGGGAEGNGSTPAAKAGKGTRASA